MKSFQQKLNICAYNKENKPEPLLYSFSKKVKLNSQQLTLPAKRQRINFIDQVNGYIETISGRNKNQKSPTKSKKQQITNKTKKVQNNSKKNTLEQMKDLNKKIKNEKEVNKNLQHCIIQIQKILWQRNERLQNLEQQLKNIQENQIKDERIKQSQRQSLQNMRKIRSTECSLKKFRNSLASKNTRKVQNVEQMSSSQASRCDETQSSQQDLQESGYIKIERSRTQSQTEMYSNYKRK